MLNLGGSSSCYYGVNMNCHLFGGTNTKVDCGISFLLELESNQTLERFLIKISIVLIALLKRNNQKDL
jgi:hypothetical protein